MKKAFFYCVSILFLTSCGNNTTVAPKLTNTATENAAPTDSITENTVDYMYVIDDFFLAIAKTKSPYAVSKKANYPLFGFIFTPTSFNGFTVHEGGYDTELSFDKNTQKYAGKGIVGLDAFEFQVMPDSNIQMTFLKTKKSYTFRKVPDADSALRKVLFEGSYTDVKTEATVSFKADGTLTGLGAEKTYQPYYDFMGGPLDFDEMEVSDKAEGSKQVYYHYKFKGNMLELYETIQPAEYGGAPEKIGKLLYTLRKN